MPSAKSSSARTTPARHGAARRGTKPSQPVVAPDQDALDALDFAARGRPEAEIGYSEDAPELTAEQLAEFEPASFRFTRRRR